MATPAQAALSFPFHNQLALSGGQSFNIVPNGVAVDDSSGKTYVAKREPSAAVEVFETATTTQLPSLDGSTTPAGSFGNSQNFALAADNTSGHVYVLDSAHNVVDEFSAAGAFLCQISGKTPVSTAEKEHECNGALGSDTPSHGFNKPDGIAVDQTSHEIFIGDAENGAIDVFSAAGAYLRQLSLAPIAGELFAEAGAGLAVNDKNGDLYLTNLQPPVVFVFDATSGAHLTTWTGANTPTKHFGGKRVLGEPVGIQSVAADNASGRVYVTTAWGSSESSNTVDVFAAGGEFITTRFGRTFVSPQGAAVDQATGRLYFEDRFNNQGVVESFGPALVLPDVTTEAPGEVKPHQAVLQGTVNPDELPLTECFFEWGKTESYGHSAECEPNAAGVGSRKAPVPVKAKIEGLEAGVTYHYRLLAANANEQNPGDDESFETQPKPSIDAAEATEVTATSAKLIAKVNPKGGETSCKIEWGQTTEPGNPAVAYEHSHACEPSENLGEGNTDVAVSLQLEGLSKDTSYHWRLLATNPSGTATGVEHTFIFLSPPPHESCPNEAFRTGPSAALPDCRAYEMVTPPVKNGALIGGSIAGLPMNFAVDGSRLTSSATQCFAASLSCPVLHAGYGLAGTSFSFSRGAGGWATSPLAPAVAQLEVSAVLSSNPDTGEALVSAPTPPTGQDDLYVHHADGSLTDLGPLTPPALGAGGVVASAISATADFSHVVVAQLSVGWPWEEPEEKFTAVEYVGAGNPQPTLVGVAGGPKSTDLISVCRTSFGAADPGSVAGESALSSDGRTVYFTADQCPAVGAHPEVPANELYARIDQSETVKISAGQCGSGPLANEMACRAAQPADAEFQGASTDGSKAFFLSTRQLTDEAANDPKGGSGSGDDTAAGAGCTETTGPNGCNLYEYDFANPAGQRLIDVSKGDTSGAGPRVQGVVAISNEGSHVYFVARGVLAGNQNGNQEVAKDGAPNLYLFERDAAHPSGQVSFIATLSDNKSGDGDLWHDAKLWTLGPIRASVSSDGRFLLFPSTAPLTKDDTRAEVGHAQIFRYDAQTGRLIRVSIGAQGFNDNGNAGLGDAQITSPVFSELLVAGGSGRRDQTMSDNGQRVFFQSPIGLTPGALNDVVSQVKEGNPQYAENVYEWEQAGIGSCPPARSAGCVYLISGGRDVSALGSATCNTASSVCLVGTDAKGENVFFSTTDQLTPSDTDTQLDFYDARVGGGFPQAANVTPCQTSETCHTQGTGPAAPQNHGSAGFNGPEEGPNHPQKPPKHHKHHKHSKHHKSKQHGKRSAHNNRRAGK